MTDEIQVLQGIDTLLFARLLENAGKEEGRLIPYQTSLSFDPQRDSDSTATKSGNVATTSSLETNLEVEFVNNISKISDDLYTSLFKNKKVETWIVYRKRRNDEGKYYAIYMRGTVTEDINDNDPDDNSTRDVTFTIDGTPKFGWLTLPEKAQAEVDYVFRGLETIDDSNKNGGGTEWQDTDTGAGSDDVSANQSNQLPGNNKE